MKKRLRKKKRLGEFREWGREVTGELAAGSSADVFIGAFIDMIEAADLRCGGGVSDKDFTQVVEIGSHDRERKWSVVETWLKERREVASWSAGPEFDLWHGRFGV